jgi:hypothetical protein
MGRARGSRVPITGSVSRHLRYVFLACWRGGRRQSKKTKNTRAVRSPTVEGNNWRGIHRRSASESRARLAGWEAGCPETRSAEPLNRTARRTHTHTDPRPDTRRATRTPHRDHGRLNSGARRRGRRTARRQDPATRLPQCSFSQSNRRRAENLRRAPRRSTQIASPYFSDAK